MSLGACLTDLVAKKLLSAARAEEMRPLYEDLVAQYEPRFGRAAAEGMATAKAMEAIEARFGDRKRQQLMQARAQHAIADNAGRLYKGAKGGRLSPAGVVAHLVDDPKAPYGNVEYRWRNIRNEAHRRMSDLLWKHRANLIGEMRHRSDFDDVVDALDGIDRGLNAREFADSWTDAAEWLRLQFNAAGGSIAKLEGWALPHQWDGVKVGLTPFETWRADVSAELDRAKMIDRLTGEPMGEARLDDLLRQVYETQVSEGAIGREPSSAAQGKAAYNRHQEHRVLHFAPGGWRRINDKYGASHAFDAMLAHVDTMARDIAAMQILGPNPDATIRWMQNLIGDAALTSSQLGDRFNAKGPQRRIEGIWDEIMGRNRVATRPNVALFFSTLRNWQTATKLGSAVLSSQADVATYGLTVRFNGLPATGAIRELVAGLNPADASHRAFAKRALLIQEEMIGRAAGFGRAHFEGELGGSLTAPTLAALREGRIGKGDFAMLQLRAGLGKMNEFSRRAANLTMRAGLLNQWTMQLRHATAMEFWNGITLYAPQRFDQLNNGFRGFLERYGIGAEGWDAIRNSPRTEAMGEQWILPDAIADRALRQRIEEGVLTELDYAVSTGGIRQRAAMTVGRPGEIPHEIVRSAGQFLLFPITVVARHAGRAWDTNTVGKKVGYAGAFLAATTLMGALAEQLHGLARGKDPRPMDTSEEGQAFWGKAMMRGGGLGYYGEIFEHAVAENGRGLEDIGNVPVLGSMSNWGGLLLREPWHMVRPAKDKKTGEAKPPEFDKAAARMLRYEVPGNNIFYLRAAYERLFLDQVDEMAGKDVAAAHRRLEKRAAEEGTGYWWKPGAPMPERSPDWARAASVSRETAE